jgi:hypothetical protein
MATGQTRMSWNRSNFPRRKGQTTMMGGPRIKHIDEVIEHEVVRIEYADGRSASVWERWIEHLPNYLSWYNRWDPGMMQRKHGHHGHHTVYILSGEMTVGDRHCAPGTHIFLMHGDTFGPWIAGPQGCETLGVVAGSAESFCAEADEAAYQALLARHGAKRVPVPPLKEFPAFRRPVLPGGERKA